MSKRNAIISLTAVIFLWATAAGQDVMMKRQEPAMKGTPMMKSVPSSNARKTKLAKKKKRTKNAAIKRRPTRK